ncbi:hypothetical protein [Xanthomonas phage X1]|nr:hypothetical protein [Xanthomonas phage X1]
MKEKSKEKLKYYAVSAKTESGDDYLFLLKAKNALDVANQFSVAMDEELGYVYYNAVEAEDPEDAKAAKKAINRAIENAEID